MYRVVTHPTINRSLPHFYISSLLSFFSVSKASVIPQLQEAYDKLLKDLVSAVQGALAQAPNTQGPGVGDAKKGSGASDVVSVYQLKTGLEMAYRRRVRTYSHAHTDIVTRPVSIILIHVPQYHTPALSVCPIFVCPSDIDVTFTLIDIYRYRTTPSRCPTTSALL